MASNNLIEDVSCTTPHVDPLGAIVCGGGNDEAKWRGGAEKAACLLSYRREGAGSQCKESKLQFFLVFGWSPCIFDVSKNCARAEDSFLGLK